MSRVSQFFFGLKKLTEGFRFLRQNRSLWPVVLLPWGLAFLLLIAGWGIFVHAFGDFYRFLLNQIGLGMADTGGLWLLQQLLKPFIFLLGILLLSLFSYFIYLIVAAPFFDLLAEKVSKISQGVEPPPFSFRRLFRSVGQSIGIELRKIGIFLAIPILLLFLNLIPAFGNFLYIGLTYLFAMWALGWGAADYAMSQRLLPFKERMRFASKQKYALMGLGTPFLIPFAPLFLQPMMVIGGTLLYYESVRHLEGEKAP